VTASCAFGDPADKKELVWDGQNWVSPSAPQPDTPEGDLADIQQLVELQDYRKVVKAVEQFLVRHSASPACEEAMNLAGQACMDQGRYWKAYQWHERQISTYPNGTLFRRALDREYKIGEAFVYGRKRRVIKVLKLDARDDGIDILLRINTHAPGTEIAAKSMICVADYYFNRAEYAHAIGVYDEFNKLYPRSNRRPYTMLQAAKAHLLSFGGVQYDDTPLLEARERFIVFAQAYPRIAKRENIPDILMEIRQTLAHKVFHSGKFYERTKRLRSAVYYYQKVVREYADTRWADDARDRLEVIGPIRPAETPLPPRQTAEHTAATGQPLAARTATVTTKPSKPTEANGPAEPKDTKITSTGKKLEEDEKTRPIRLEDLKK
jgi:outer membrane assembly lipoprotein YfiO